MNVRSLALSACHCLAALPAKMSALNSLMQQRGWYRNTKWTFADLLLCYCYAIKTNSRKIGSQLSQPHLCRQRKGHEWTANSSLHDTITWLLTLVQCEFHTGKKTVWVSYRTWLLCSVSFIPAKKLSLQEWNQLIGIKMPTSVFSRNICFIIPISKRGANFRFAPVPCGRPFDHWLFYIRFHKQGQLI